MAFGTVMTCGSLRKPLMLKLDDTPRSIGGLMAEDDLLAARASGPRGDHGVPAADDVKSLSIGAEAGTGPWGPGSTSFPVIAGRLA